MEFQTMGMMMSPIPNEEEGEKKIEDCVASPGYGKDICALMKSIRDEEAREHGIDYKSAECEYMDTCTGPCKKCEEEAELLYKLIYKKKDE